MSAPSHESEVDVENTDSSSSDDSFSAAFECVEVGRSLVKRRSLQKRWLEGSSVWMDGLGRKRKLSRDGDEGQPMKRSRRAEEKRFGGYPQLVAEVERLMGRVLSFRTYARLGLSLPRGLLVHGPSGCGKALLVSTVASRLGLSLQAVTPLDLAAYSPASSIRRAFELATNTQPSVVLIDGLEVLYDRSDVQNYVAFSMDGLPPGVLVIGTTDSLDCLSPLIRTTGRFERVIHIEVPGLEDRNAILEVLTREIKLDDELSLQDLALLTPGFLGSNLKELVSEAGIVAVEKLSSRDEIQDLSNGCLEDFRIQLDDFKVALKRVNPPAKRVGLAGVPEVSWEDVGALDYVRRQLETSIILPATHPQECATMGIERPAGILLCGPPGCGKTLLAKAMANELRVNFLSVKGPELLSRYFGESERGVRDVFHRAACCRPCVIFLDEVDALCPRRHMEAGSQAMCRVVTQLLTELDGVEERRGVHVLAATNRPDLLEPALLRPGRLEKLLWVELPSAAGRSAILRSLTRRVPLADPDLADLAADPRLEGFSGADLSALVKEACLLALTSHLDRGTPLAVTRDMLLQVADRLRPSVSQKELSFYQDLKVNFSERGT